MMKQVPEVIYQVFEEPSNRQDATKPDPDQPQSLEDFVLQMKLDRPDARTFALKLKAMVSKTVITFARETKFKLTSLKYQSVS